MKLRPYQEQFVNNIAIALTKNRKICAQLSTGGGKTICFSAISSRYIHKSQKPVLILVHRKELLSQAANSLEKANGITAQRIVAGMKTIPDALVYVGMVETVFKRLDLLSHVGLIIIDECHLGGFTKIIDHFQSQLIIGFTATPLAAKKTQPLNLFFNDIICGIDIPELIGQGHLCKEITYGAKETVDRAKLKMKMGDFDEKQMAKEFSNPKFIQTTVNAYQKLAENTKTIVFNCNIEHSKLVTEQFRISGYVAKHIDANSKDREEILHWFNQTENAILCNVGIATTGFDQPDIQTVIVNKATASMPLWLQMCGRGGRPTKTKDRFTIIDLGGNTVTHGQWSDQRDWIKIFRYPPKKNKPGVAPVKDCPNCQALIAVRSMKCPYCEYVFPEKENQEQLISEFILLSKDIDVEKLIQSNKQYKEYYTFFDISRQLALNAKAKIPKINEQIYDEILSRNFELAKQWCHANKKRFNTWHKEQAQSTLEKELTKLYPKWQKHSFQATSL
jgi:superfamily II DNA or RNA helicase